MSTATKKTHDTTEASPNGPVVTKVGNLCADPELRFAASGKPYCRLRIAVSTPVKPGDWAGERKTTFYDVTAFGTLAENAAESLHKGDRVFVTGRGEVRTWTGDDGVERTGKGILADALGPDLRFATVEVQKAHQAGSPAAGDGAASFDEEPF